MTEQQQPRSMAEAAAMLKAAGGGRVVFMLDPSKLSREAPPGFEAAARRAARASAPRPPKQPPPPLREPCVYQGELVGRAKVSCREGFTPAYACLCLERPPRLSKRNGRALRLLALPLSQCEAADGTVQQPCSLCRFWIPVAAPSTPEVQ